MTDLVKVSRLWANKGKGWGGKLKESITIPAGARLMLFEETDKRSDSDADYSLLYAPPDDEQQPNGRGGYEPRHHPERPSQARREAAITSQAPTRTGRHSDMARMPVDPDDDLNDRIPF
jgi:hypothetical protein